MLRNAGALRPTRPADRNAFAALPADDECGFKRSRKNDDSFCLVHQVARDRGLGDLHHVLYYVRCLLDAVDRRFELLARILLFLPGPRRVKRRKIARNEKTDALKFDLI